MASTDLKLGGRVREFLQKKGLESPINFERQSMISGAGKAHIESAIADILGVLGMDIKDDSIGDTPARVAKMYTQEIFYGLDYANFPKCTAIENKMGYEEMVLMKDILVRSVCEHHLVPFIGSAHVAYIPGKKVIGLSKLNRIVDFFSRRPQVQERLTEQVAHTLAYILETDDVAVVIDCEHFCVKLRGIQDPQSSTITSKVLGKFRTNDALRNEFLHLSKGGK
jgi:GTP cyclohydrolase IA